MATEGTRNVSRVIRDAIPTEEELMGSLDPRYFTEDFDPSAEALDRLPADLSDVEPISSNRKRRFYQLEAVSKRLSALVRPRGPAAVERWATAVHRSVVPARSPRLLTPAPTPAHATYRFGGGGQQVLDHHKEFMQELTRVTELSEELDLASLTCKSGQRHLNKANKRVRQSLGVVYKTRKRDKLMSLLKCLRAIAVLRDIRNKLEELLGANEYLAAIELYNECESTAVVYGGFACVGELAAGLHETRAMIEKHLDDSLGRLVADFRPEPFEQVILSFDALKDPTQAAERLGPHFVNSLQAVARATLVEHARGGPQQQEVVPGVPVCPAVPREPPTFGLCSVCLFPVAARRPGQWSPRRSRVRRRSLG